MTAQLAMLVNTTYLQFTMVFSFGHHHVHLHGLTGWGLACVTA